MGNVPVSTDLADDDVDPVQALIERALAAGLPARRSRTGAAVIASPGGGVCHLAGETTAYPAWLAAALGEHPASSPPARPKVTKAQRRAMRIGVSEWLTATCRLHARSSCEFSMLLSAWQKHAGDTSTPSRAFATALISAARGRISIDRAGDQVLGLRLL